MVQFCQQVHLAVSLVKLVTLGIHVHEFQGDRRHGILAIAAVHLAERPLADS